jgi:hypothetical protein
MEEHFIINIYLHPGLCESLQNLEEFTQMVGLVVSSSSALRLFISVSDERSPMYYSGVFTAIS